MEECDAPPARFKRKAWAQSRDSWQASESQDQGAEEQLSAQPIEDKPSTATQSGPVPNKITSWLNGCRTPLGSSLDEQGTSPSKGALKNGCSFEDDLSLGAEANHLQNSKTNPEANGYELPAKDKRSQFKQKGRSMNSTGSGKSNTTVSSVSELLDLYEEDPEEILYNLGFGREEPDIASKIPSRFFSASSRAKGIDIKVYLGAQMQRMEVENPNYALTSRFRQTEVLATVANVFSEIYSHVSGRPAEKIDTETKTPSLLKKNNSALNVAKILKRNITKQNLLASSTEGSAKQLSSSNAEGEGVNPVRDVPSDVEQKPQQKMFWRKDSSLATVTEEAQQGISEASLNGDNHGPLTNGDLSTETPALEKDIPDSPVLVSISQTNDVTDAARETIHKKQETITSTPDKELPNLLPNPHMAHLLIQPRDSFEMEELQSNEDEALPGPGGMFRPGSDRLLRTTSQQSDSSGFAEDPSTDGSGNHLKVQESSDSCDSETTVTSHAGDATTPLALDYPIFDRLHGGEAFPQPNRGSSSESGAKQDISEMDNLQNPHSNNCINGESVTESGYTTAQDPSTNSSDVGSCTVENPTTNLVSNGDQESKSQSGLGVDPERNIPSQTASESSEGLHLDSCGPESPTEPSSTLVHESSSGKEQRRQFALHLTQQRSSSVAEERPGRVWVRDLDLLKGRESLDRNPLRRSSSLPTSPHSPARVVTSLRIQLGRGSVKHCTPPSYTYRYEEGTHGDREEVDSIIEEDEDVDRFGYHSDPVEGDMSGIGYGTPPHLLNVPQHLARSSSSLYSVPADWPPRPLGEGPSWSTCSVPNLPHFTGPAHPPPPHGPTHSPHFKGAYNSSYPTNLNHIPHHSPMPQHQNLNGPQSFTPPQWPPFTPHQLNRHFPQPHSAPHYHPSATFHSPHNFSQGAPYGSSFSPYHPHVPPYYLAYTSSSHPPGTPPNHPYYPSPSCPLSYQTPPAPSPAPLLGSTEMQLRRVLHDIRSTMQNLTQGPSMHGGDTPVDRISSPCSVQPLYEELQIRRRSLNVFRTQMMDLELALMRQQSVVYQHLSPEERLDADQLQTLRTAVRQELQELELQLEERLLNLNQQMRSSSQNSGVYRHHMGLNRGNSIDSLSNSLALQAVEPVTDLLREQLYLQSELGYDAATSISGQSSRASSPERFNRAHGSCSPSPKQGGIYRATLNLTPSLPSRPGVEVPQPGSPERPERSISPTSVELNRDDDDRSRTSEDCGPTEWRSRSGGHGDLQHLIKEIKQSIAYEIRQEIVNELLAAVSPQRSPLPARKPPV
ncbi:protein ITPRID2 isoform X2 [Misgurnus anguillicaudatus]|uniref:protein ITPRID2 isoform X2 n=1 Tax=Misgurnus anguillicaudatus TaxID=75329 RepID=UPI003CCF79A4